MYPASHVIQIWSSEQEIQWGKADEHNGQLLLSTNPNKATTDM